MIWFGLVFIQQTYSKLDTTPKDIFLRFFFSSRNLLSLKKYEIRLCVTNRLSDLLGLRFYQFGFKI